MDSEIYDAAQTLLLLASGLDIYEIECVKILQKL